jgi:hypothetical protein
MIVHDELTLRFTGIAPLLMRSGRMADPLDEHAAALHRVTSKRMKTAADHLQVARLEFRGSLWLMNGRPCVPAEAVEASLVSAGRSRRAGTLVRAAVIVRDSPLLEYAGPTDLDELFEDKRFVHRCGVRVNRATTMRTRPRFNEWSLTVTLSYLPTMIEGSTLLDVARLAGNLVGIGDFRPRFGRFHVEAAG